MKRGRIYTVLAVASATSIAFQLVIVQIYSFTQWYHFAFMVISIALLGMGVAGSLIFARRKWMLEKADKLFPGCIVLAGIGMVAACYLCQWEPFRFDSFLVFTGVRQWIKVPLTYFLFFVPFFFSSLAIGLVITAEHERVGKIYFWNLLGAGAGAFAGWGLMWFLVPEKIAIILALLNIIASWFCFPTGKRHSVKWAVGVLVLFVILSFFYPPRLIPSEFKDLSRTMNLPVVKVKREIISPYGRIHIVESPLLRYAPGLSLTFHGLPPCPPQVFINGDAAGPLFENLTDLGIPILDYTLAALPWSFSDPKRVLVLTYDTGAFAAYAHFMGAESVTFVTSNPVLARLLTNNLPVRVVYSDPRSWLETEKIYYDLIYFPVLGIPGGNAGVNAIAEDHLFTVEGVRKACERLDPAGLLVLVTWEDYPLRYPLKLFSTIQRALGEKGSLVMVRGINQIAFVIKKTSFTPEEMEKLVFFSHHRGFIPFVNALPEEFSWSRNIDDYPFHISPATDDRPYVHQFLRPRSLFALTRYYGWDQVPFFEVGYLIIFITLIQVIMVAFSFLFLPFLHYRPQRWTGVFFCFSGIGLGYMLVEMVLIQRFILFFGSTVTSMTVIVSMMLISSGLGSRLVALRGWQVDRLISVAVVIIATIFAMGFFLSPLLIATAGFPVWCRLIISIFLVSPLAFLMGMPFPVCIKALGETEEAAVPWAWGINGFFSVLGACLAPILSVEAGFKALMWVAAFAYVGVIPFSLSVHKRS